MALLTRFLLLFPRSPPPRSGPLLQLLRARPLPVCPLETAALSLCARCLCLPRKPRPKPTSPKPCWRMGPRSGLWKSVECSHTIRMVLAGSQTHRLEGGGHGSLGMSSAFGELWNSTGNWMMEAAWGPQEPSCPPPVVQGGQRGPDLPEVTGEIQSRASCFPTPALKSFCYPTLSLPFTAPENKFQETF